MGGARTAGAAAVALGLGVAVFLWRTRHIAGTIGVGAFPLDDSWIHMQFARNLAEGRGFTYNPGVPVSGSTAPLWTLALGGAFAVLGAHPVLAKALGLVFTCATAWLSGILAERWTDRRELALLAAALTALAGPMVWGALSGMEVSLAALLVTAALVLRAAEREAAAALALGLGALARPEAVLLLPLFWLSGPLTWRRALTWLGPVALCVAPWVAFNVATIGNPLPGTALAKIEGGLLGALAGVREPLATSLVRRPSQYFGEWIRWLWRVDVLLPLLLLPGMAWLGRHRGRAALVPACVLLVHPLAMALLAPYRGPGFQEGRYSIHLLPLALVVAVASLATVGGVWLRRVGALALLVAVLVALPGAASRYGWAVQNIEAMQVHLAHWVIDHTPPTARLGLNDVGAITYFSRREIVDVMGLVTPAILPYRREGEAGVLRYLERTCPDYLIVFPAWFPSLSAMADRFRPVYRVHLDHNTVAGADELVVYETVWSRWAADRQPCPGALAAAAGQAAGRRKIGGSYNRGVDPLKRPTPILLVSLLLGGILVAAPGPVSAQIYRWTDERGDTRYSQGINSVPPQSRGSAVIMSTPSQPPPSAPAAAEAPSDGGAPAGVARIPFIPGRPIVVNARINGSGSAQLILDTGAQGTVISPTALAALGVSYRNAARGTIRGVTGETSVLAVRIENIEVEGARFGPLMVISHDAGLGSGTDGLLGRDFLDNFIVTIDSSNRVVTLTPKK
jgi:hypothetical protein